MCVEANLYVVINKHSEYSILSTDDVLTELSGTLMKGGSPAPWSDALRVSYKPEFKSYLQAISEQVRE